MLERLANVDFIHVKTFSYSSIFQIGDSRIINGFSRALAVQREAEVFYGNEGNLPSFDVIIKPITLPTITENLTLTFHNLPSVIKVKNINVKGFSNASVLHVGNSRNISMEARVKHIRQLLPHGHEHETR
ncbi:spore germination protein GerPE [Bacillus sp. BRMEA1]|uniref:spore germination protein GerPE n=1 Tax=Neobacillus endophyticus TaxID=2738405 RepID=UPI0015666AFB|nr:spore germination protein GerPE [Neobacillus endophyticus]NRD78386.1 spore germination protein GerPE [Neobacillus endophyticus]